jgi:hypothetical protein
MVRTEMRKHGTGRRSSIRTVPAHAPRPRTGGPDDGCHPQVGNEGNPANNHDDDWIAAAAAAMRWCVCTFPFSRGG